MRVIITGATKWTDAEAIRRELAILPSGTVVIHGDALGVDTLAGQVARELGFLVEAFKKEKADYQRYRSGAWKALNERMIESGAELVLAFHPELNEKGKAKGSKHMIGLAEKRGVQVKSFLT